MSRMMAEALQQAPHRSGQARHRPPLRRLPVEMPFEPQRLAGRAPTARTQTLQAPYAQRPLRTNRASQTMMYVFLAMAMVLVFLQIGQLAGMSQNSKQIAQLNATIREKKNEAGNLNMRLSMQSNIKRVHDEAVHRLGMIQPEDGQIRVVSPIAPSTELQQQTALSSDVSVE